MCYQRKSWIANLGDHRHCRQVAQKMCSVMGELVVGEDQKVMGDNLGMVELVVGEDQKVMGDNLGMVGNLLVEE